MSDTNTLSLRLSRETISSERGNPVVPTLCLSERGETVGRESGWGTLPRVYRGTLLIRKRNPLGPFSRTMPRALWGS